MGPHNVAHADGFLGELGEDWSWHAVVLGYVLPRLCELRSGNVCGLKITEAEAVFLAVFFCLGTQIFAVRFVSGDCSSLNKGGRVSRRQSSFGQMLPERNVNPISSAQRRIGR